MNRRNMLKYASQTTFGVIAAIGLPGCGLERNRYEHHVTGKGLNPLKRYDGSKNPPLLTGNAMAILARDYKKLAEKYHLATDIYTIRPGTRFSINIKGKQDYNQVVQVMSTMDLYGLGVISVLGRPFESVRTQIKAGYSNMLHVHPNDITVNVDKIVEGETPKYALVSIFSEQGGKLLKLGGPTNLDWVLASAGMPTADQEWNEIAITRPVRDDQHGKTSIAVQTELGKREIDELVMIADMEGAITGKGNSMDNIPMLHGDRIFLATEQRPWPVLIRDWMQQVYSVTGSGAGIGSSARSIDGAVGYFEKNSNERR